MLALAPAGRLATLSQRARLPSAQLPAVAVGAVILATVSTAAVGALLASRRPRHPVGWLLLGIGLGLAASALVEPYVKYGLIVRPVRSRGPATWSGSPRFRHARGIERQQLRWLALAAILGALLLLVALVAGFVLSEDGVVLTSLALCVALLPLATGAAILRYRLYDLDRIISRTLAWTLLTLLLALAYAAVVLGLGRLLPQNSNLGVAAATLAVAALFQPLRRRVQQAVDRRFNRRRHDAARLIEAFGARLRDQVDLDALHTELLAVVDQTIQPTRASLWLRPRAGGSR